MTKQAKRLIKNPSGYHSKGSTPIEKLQNFAMFIKQFEWTGAWDTDPESGMVTLKASNGDNERIDIEWPDGQPSPDVWYTYAGYTIKCRNISMAAKLAQDPPNAERMRRVALRARKGRLGASLYPPSGTVDGRSRDRGSLDLPGLSESLRSDPRASEAIIASLATALPFDKESTPEELKHELVRKNITWVNRISGGVNTAYIKPKKFTVTKNYQGRTILNFADEEGFHSVYIDSIIGVS